MPLSEARGPAPPRHFQPSASPALRLLVSLCQQGGPQRVSAAYKSLEVTHPAGSSPKGLPGDRVQFFFDSQRSESRKSFQKKEKK